MVDHRIQKGLFLFATTNSLFNPLIYGLFHIRSQRNRKSEMRIRQTLLANNCRLERIDRLDFIDGDEVAGHSGRLIQYKFKYIPPIPTPQLHSHSVNSRRSNSNVCSDVMAKN